MSPKRQINGEQFVADLRAGMSDTELMEKHQLSSRMLQKIFRKLLNAKVISPAEIYDRTPFDDTTVDVDTISASLSGYTALATSVYEVSKPEILGTLLDVTEKELVTLGIDASFSETKQFVILAAKGSKIEPIILKAKCRWIKEDPNVGLHKAGFEISFMSAEHVKDLKKLIRAFALPVGG